MKRKLRKPFGLALQAVCLLALSIILFSAFVIALVENHYKILESYEVMK